MITTPDRSEMIQYQSVTTPTETPGANNLENQVPKPVIQMNRVGSRDVYQSLSEAITYEKSYQIVSRPESISNPQQYANPNNLPFLKSQYVSSKYAPTSSVLRSSELAPFLISFSEVRVEKEVGRGKNKIFK